MGTAQRASGRGDGGGRTALRASTSGAARARLPLYLKASTARRTVPSYTYPLRTRVNDGRRAAQRGQMPGASAGSAHTGQIGPLNVGSTARQSAYRWDPGRWHTTH